MKQVLAFACALALCVGASASDDGGYKSKVLDWRKAQETDLKKPDGWLAVAGLFWLSEGENSVGTSDDCKVKLPARLSNKSIGPFVLSNGQVTDPKHELEGLSAPGKPAVGFDTMTMDDVTLKVIKRGSRVGIRMIDPESKARHDFKGMKWMPVNAKYCIQAKFIPNDQPTELQITNVLGDTNPVSSPGYVTFTIDGQECRLNAEPNGNGLFFNFADATSGKSTYPAGRFLYTDAPVNGMVTLDFNEAMNPPCAWTAYATCPLPPAGNRLTVAIKAGELVHHAEK